MPRGEREGGGGRVRQCSHQLFRPQLLAGHQRWRRRPSADAQPHATLPLCAAVADALARGLLKGCHCCHCPKPAPLIAAEIILHCHADHRRHVPALDAGRGGSAGRNAPVQAGRHWPGLPPHQACATHHVGHGLKTSFFFHCFLLLNKLTATPTPFVADHLAPHAEGAGQLGRLQRHPPWRQQRAQCAALHWSVRAGALLAWVTSCAPPVARVS